MILHYMNYLKDPFIRILQNMAAYSVDSRPVQQDTYGILQRGYALLLTLLFRFWNNSVIIHPPKVSLLWRSGGACVVHDPKSYAGCSLCYW
jgi:hypothetical protein